LYLANPVDKLRDDPKFWKFRIRATQNDSGQKRKTWAGGCACAPTQEEAAALVEDRGSADDDE
jgi:hypothetical protein